MESNNVNDEEFSNSEDWLAENIFSHLKDFNLDSVEYEKAVYCEPTENQPAPEFEDTVYSNILDLNAPLEVQTMEAPTENIISIITSDNGNPDLHTIQDLRDIGEVQEINAIEAEIGANNNQNQNYIQYIEPLVIRQQIKLQIIKCANCNCIFDPTAYHEHICDYDENNQLIIPEPVTISTNPPQYTIPAQINQNEPACMRLLRENQIRIRRFLKEELKYDVNATNLKKQSGPHECSLCERKFVHASGLSRHMEKHTLDLIPSMSTQNTNTGHPSINGLRVAIKCTVCGQIFFKSTIALEHFNLHFPRATKKDEQEFDTMSQFPYENFLDDALDFLKLEAEHVEYKPVTYLKIVILNCVLQCEFCDLIFSEAFFLFTHSANHKPHMPFECHSCGIRVLTSKEILMHWQVECIYTREGIKSGCTAQRFHVCNVCENKFTSLEQLHEHRYSTYHFFPRLDKRSEILLLPCEYCGTVFDSAKDIVKHYEEKHFKKSRRGTAVKYRQYLCDICGKTYTQSSHLWQHLRFHKGVKPFACKEPGCSRRFTIRPDLNDHIRKCHTGERPYHCLICGRRFLTGSVFYQHRLIHRGERRYGCNECGKRFYRADALKNHLRIHTGEKPYGCLFCTKCFRQRGDRDKHIRARHSSLDANARLMMQMQKLKLEAAAKKKASGNQSDASPPSGDLLLLGNISFPQNIFQPVLSGFDNNQD